MKIKNKFKINKLFLYPTLNSFNLNNTFMQRLNNLKIYKFLTNINYTCFIFHIFYSKIKYKQIIFLNHFFPFRELKY